MGCVLLKDETLELLVTPMKLMGSFQERRNGRMGRETMALGIHCHKRTFAHQIASKKKKDNGRLIRPNGQILQLTPFANNLALFPSSSVLSDQRGKVLSPAVNQTL